MSNRRVFAQHFEADPAPTYYQPTNRSSFSPGSSVRSRVDQGPMAMPLIELSSSSPCGSPSQLAMEAWLSSVDQVLEPQGFRTFDTMYEDYQAEANALGSTISDFVLATSAAAAFHTSTEDLGLSKQASDLEMSNVSSSGSQMFDDTFTLNSLDYVPMTSSHLGRHQSDSHDPDLSDIMDPDFDLGLSGWDDHTLPTFTDINGEIISMSEDFGRVGAPAGREQINANGGYGAQFEDGESLIRIGGPSKEDVSSRIADPSDARQRKQLGGNFRDVDIQTPMEATKPRPDEQRQTAVKWPADPFIDSTRHQNSSAHVPRKCASTDAESEAESSAHCVVAEGRPTFPTIDLSNSQAPTDSIMDSEITTAKMMGDPLTSLPAQKYTDNSVKSIPDLSPSSELGPEGDEADDDVIIATTRERRSKPKANHPQIPTQPVTASVEEGEFEGLTSQVEEDRKKREAIEEEEVLSRKRRRRAIAKEPASSFVERAKLVPSRKNLNRNASKGLVQRRKFLRHRPGSDRFTSSPQRPTDYREKEPITQAEYQNLQEALHSTRVAYYEWTGADAPVTDGWLCYMDQWRRIEASFKSTWSVSQSVLKRRPRLFKLPAWKDTIENWPQPVKDKFYFAPFKYGHWAPIREDEKLMDLPGELLEEASQEDDRKAFMKGVMYGLKHMAPAVWRHHYDWRPSE